MKKKGLSIKLIAGILGLALVFTTMLTSCGGGGGGNDPKKVVENYLAAVGKGDWNGAKKFLTGGALEKIESVGDNKEALAMLSGLASMLKLSAADAEIDGDTALVRFDGSMAPYHLVKEGGLWKIED